ncbi:MAG: ATP-binding protein [Gemmatimonas sp.]
MKELASDRTPATEWIIWAAVMVAVTAALVAMRERITNTHVALAYLLLVQIGSARRGRMLGIALALVSFFCIDWFFIPPFGTLSVAKPLDLLVLAAFLITAFVATHLFERARAREREVLEARDRASELDRIASHADSLRETARLKDALIASVSHDLRTPLTTIKAVAHEIAAGGDERALTIEEESDRLNLFVGNLLDLSRLSSGTPMDIGPNEAEDLLGAALQAAGGATKGREIRVKVIPSETMLFGSFDFSQTLRALVNLIENAVKHSPADAPVDITAERKNKWLAIVVSDRGPGVAESERQRIFEPFYRPAGQQPDVGGAGLGLSIARAIAEAQGGSLDYSPRDGGGSDFILRLPALDVPKTTAARS